MSEMSLETLGFRQISGPENRFTYDDCGTPAMISVHADDPGDEDGDDQVGISFKDHGTDTDLYFDRAGGRAFRILLGTVARNCAVARVKDVEPDAVPAIEIPDVRLSCRHADVSWERARVTVHVDGDDADIYIVGTACRAHFRLPLDVVVQLGSLLSDTLRLREGFLEDI